MDDVMWCPKCGKRFSNEEIATAMACPACKSDGVPCSVNLDFTVEVNWHELRILTIWAERWAGHIDKGDESNLVLIRCIARRLEQQVEGEGVSPLMLAGELVGLREHFGEIETNIPSQPMVVVNGPGAVGHSRKPKGK